MLVKPALAWSLYGKLGWGTYTCTAYPSVPALCQAAGGWLGSHWHYCMKGSELGLHSTGVCLSFCLNAFCYYCVIFLLYFITLEITCQKINDFSVHSILSFSGKNTVQYLCTKCFPRALSCFLHQDSHRMNQVAWVSHRCVFKVFRFLNVSFLASDGKGAHITALCHGRMLLLYALTTNLGVTLALRGYFIMDSYIRGSGRTLVSISDLRRGEFSYTCNGWHSIGVLIDAFMNGLKAEKIKNVKHH